MNNSLRALVFLSVLAALPLLCTQEWHLDVPYVPTRPEVVAKMLEMARVGKDDVLYDLGCGDGRIVITAAKLYGTRGVGVDLNPERIRECHENAKKEGVTSLVTFLQQDLFQTDFHEASVVMLYLMPSVNLRLRPILFAQIRPGARVISHDFSMGTWEPDDSAMVEAGGLIHEVYSWMIPANVSGSWAWTLREGGKLVPCRLDLEQHFQVISGKVNIGGQDLPLISPTLVGDRIEFLIAREEGGKERRVIYVGRVVRNSMEGTMTVRGAVKPARKPWSAERNPATMKRIDTDGAGRF
jgi:SAM-dependent methyltransferase